MQTVYKFEDDSLTWYANGASSKEINVAILNIGGKRTLRISAEDLGYDDTITIGNFDISVKEFCNLLGITKADLE